MDRQISVPGAGSPSYPDVVTFALSYNAYHRRGGFKPVASKANALREDWDASGLVPDDVEYLRSALFFEQRRWRHFDREPAGRDREYIDAVLEGLRRGSGGSVPGPADPLP